MWPARKMTPSRAAATAKMAAPRSDSGATSGARSALAATLVDCVQS